LLDEIEKADPAVFDLLLQVAGEGRLTDARGRTAYFHNTIIIMTSNLGTAEKRVRVGIDAAPVGDEEHYLAAVKRSFRPEFVNRLDRIVAFHELSAAEVEQVAKVALERLKRRRGFVELGAELDLSDASVATLARDGYSEQYGARALRRHIDDHLLGPVARLLGKAGVEAKQGVIRVESLEEPERDPPALIAGGLRFTLERKPASVARREVKGIEGILWVRRKIDRFLELDPVEQIKEQLAFLVSQLAYGRGTGEDRRSAKEIGELHVEHHRLSEIYGEAVHLRQEIEAIEELAIAALYASNAEAAIDLRPEAEQVMRRFRHAMVYLLVAQEKQRDEITLLLQELDDGRLLDRWLVPLLDDARRRGWALTLHASGDLPLPHETWPRDRRFGPPRSPEWMREHLAKPDRSRAVLLRASGPYAGILLSLEGGLHRWSNLHPSIEPVKMLVHRVAPRAAIRESDWVKQALIPPPPPSERELSAWAACREMDPRLEKLKLAARRVEIDFDPKAYWTRYEEIALEHLLLFGDRNLDRSELLINKLDPIGG
jgi:ATP-dependent Clp protease ATP-binding subunit ClpC